MPQPRGIKYFFGTWSGRILLVNGAVFAWMTWASQSLMVPSPEVLLQAGSKDVVKIAQGEYWRFLTPIFVHIGIIHFLFNSMGLYYIGYQTEKLLGPKWFIGIYLFSGVFGNVVSAVTSTALSAGASGSLFGLLGTGFIIERLIGKRMEEQTGMKPRRGVYGSMVVTNLILGIVIPGIDNGAHIGGMVAGVLMTLVMLRTRPNGILARKPRLALFITVPLVLATTAGGALACCPDFVESRLLASLAKDDKDELRYHRLGQLVELRPNDLSYRLQRIRILMMHEEGEEAREDIAFLGKSPLGYQMLLDLASELENAGHENEAWLLRSLPPPETKDL